jgi:hypothetical protein
MADRRWGYAAVLAFALCCVVASGTEIDTVESHFVGSCFDSSLRLFNPWAIMLPGEWSVPVFWTAANIIVKIPRRPPGQICHNVLIQAYHI